MTDRHLDARVNSDDDGTMTLIVTDPEQHTLIDPDVYPESLGATVQVTPKLLAHLVKRANAAVELRQLYEQLGRMSANLEHNAAAPHLARRLRKILEARAYGIDLASAATKARLDRVER